MFRVFCVAIGLVLAVPLKAEVKLEPFVSLSAGVNQVKVAREQFLPKSLQAAIGVMFWKGVGLEFQSSVSGSSDEGDIDIEMSVEDYRAALLRFQAYNPEGWSAFAHIGYGEFLLKADSASRGVEEEKLDSGIYALGLEYAYQSFKGLSGSLAYEYNYGDEQVDIRSLRFDLRYRFGS